MEGGEVLVKQAGKRDTGSKKNVFSIVLAAKESNKSWNEEKKIKCSYTSRGMKGSRGAPFNEGARRS